MSAVVQDEAQYRAIEFFEARRQYAADLELMDQQEWEARTRELDRLRDEARRAQDRSRRSKEWTPNGVRADAIREVERTSKALGRAEVRQQEAICHAASMGCSMRSIGIAAGLSGQTIKTRLDG
jgi:hypothetical protein